MAEIKCERNTNYKGEQWAAHEMEHAIYGAKTKARLVRAFVLFMLYFFHLALAAFFAISDRSSAVSFFARAAPPFKPPSRPNSWAALFFSGFGSIGGASPVASSTIRLASWLRSSRPVLERLGIIARIGTSPRFRQEATISN
jgi:hypothetical protein